MADQSFMTPLACVTPTSSLARWRWGACVALFVVSAVVQAQTVYRITGPDGRVTFSDKPALSSAAKVTPLEGIANTPIEPTTVPLPLELRQVVSQFPVTLYTGSNCTPCDSGRSLLQKRGVPFTEKTIASAQDADALNNLSGATALPFLTIGTQHVAGFSSSEWTTYLNAAGYPAQNKLPASYRAPAASPLVALPKPAPNNVPSASPNAVVQHQPAKPAPVAPRNPNNPAGIQF
ncbi:MAG: glutaredoxin family protein [Rhodoferax sp.]|nr:glutaredoxin family protein [Rhodoferax sp.]